MYNLDEMVARIYKELEIEAGKIYMHTICAKLNIILRVCEEESSHMVYRGTYYIIVDSRNSPQAQTFDFAHELAHFLLHDGNQRKSSRVYIEYQERQANNFAERFLVPMFLLRQLELPNDRADAAYLVEKTFKVDAELAKKRLALYERQLYEEYKNRYAW
ncbi:ImmA/IrrE family metallo-endopeptidase [Listeria booriae]|uniref:ImmA/IrrE family metallo-endopeptidase n=1 Tax=Listeria booriae TaxID=1552123 RepID=A0A7X1D4X2_9LIST|nr:ImmA/IrrE family metallo-endopeptidase [Listeria booriae]MBC2166190.1 ImmA/IrrE family metallo-endopeptidase [Listeria booriae]